MRERKRERDFLECQDTDRYLNLDLGSPKFLLCFLSFLPGLRVVLLGVPAGLAKDLRHPSPNLLSMHNDRSACGLVWSTFLVTWAQWEEW